MQDEDAKNAPQIRATVPSSPQSRVTPVRGSFAPKYPWGTIPIGQSFIVYHNEMKLTSLRPFAHRMGKKHGKKFRVIDHGADVGYEVACLPMDEQAAIASGGGIVETLNKMGEAPNFEFEKEKGE